MTDNAELAFSVTVSIGPVKSEPGYMMSDLICKADQALYLARKQGKTAMAGGNRHSRAFGDKTCQNLTAVKRALFSMHTKMVQPAPDSGTPEDRKGLK